MNLLLIPSAILVPTFLKERVGEIPTVLFPLNGKTMLEHICDLYQDKVDRTCVIVFKNHILVEDFVRWKHMAVDVVCLDKLGDIGYTISCGLQKYADKTINHLFINFADTLIEKKAIFFKDIVHYSSKTRNEEWTYFVENDGIVADMYVQCVPHNIADAKLITGAFAFSDVLLFKQLLTNRILENASEESFWKSIKDYSEQRAFKFIETDWFDIGHVENFYKAKTEVESRSFNEIEIDEKRGILTKRSNNVDKFLGEIVWYIKLPGKLQYMIPRIYSYSIARENPYVEMEYYGYQTLHELLIYGDVPLIKWQSILGKLLFIMKDMQSFQVNDKTESRRKALEEIYINKVIGRISTLRDNSQFSGFFNKSIFINGREYPSLEKIIDIYKHLVEKKIIFEKVSPFTIIHGDLCFTNILLEDKHEFLRIIDPRGQFGSYDIYGDSRYEIAKIMHSIEGGYDYIIEDMFELKIADNHINYSVPNNDAVYNVFCNVFRKEIENLNVLRLIEASLFLSMIPLHNDSCRRQYAMLVTGLQLLWKVIEDERN